MSLSQQAKQWMFEGFEKILADTYVLYLKTQNFHWNVRGPNFYPLHLLFETHYKEMAEAIDEIAERMGALGFFVHASFSFFKTKARIKEEEKILSAHEMLTHLIEGHELLIQELRALCVIAEREQDAGSVDLIGRRLLAHEKMAWFLRSQV
ncbi:MAG: hypothetical protein RLZZ453_1231 [Chlamydiota bacterium]